MYSSFFGLKHAPFSIAPDPRYLYMSERHREALAHLLYGVQAGGGFVLLTGEIGAGKTTVCRCFLEQVPRQCNVAYIFNPKLSALELLQTVCHEFGIPVSAPAPGLAPSVKDHVDALNTYLLRTYSVGQSNVLIIDEAQNLTADVLEQLRLLTNLETHERKLLQIILIGQPELRTMLARPELEQLAQRVIARYHLQALSERETAKYVAHRMAVAGLQGALPFDAATLRRIHQLTQGVPRRINLLCDRALLGAYATGKPRVDPAILDKAASEVFGPRAAASRPVARYRTLGLGVGIGVLAGAAAFAAVQAVQWGSRASAASASSAPANASSAAGVSAARAVTAAAPMNGAGATPAPASRPAASAASAAGAHPLRSIEDLEARLQQAPREERDALRQLAALWQIEPGAVDPCAAALRSDVACYRAHGSLPLLRQLGRPVVLGLRDAHDRPVYVVLTGLGSDAATLRIDNESLVVPLSLLTTSWRGDFATFWREPPGYTGSISEGARGPLVDLLAARLAHDQSASAPAPSQAFDATLKARVYTFQLAQGLTPDGVIGPTTLMQLNRTSGVAEPWLQGAADDARR